MEVVAVKSRSKEVKTVLEGMVSMSEARLAPEVCAPARLEGEQV